MLLQDALLRQKRLKTEREEVVNAHNKEIKLIDEQLDECSKFISYGKAGFNLEKIARAKSLVKVSNVNTKVRESCVTRFIDKLASQPNWLKEYYCGVKVYSGLGEQHSDHSIGAGPRHGSIVFSVQLNPIARGELDKDEIEDIIYYLLNIRAIQRAEHENEA